ncbi:group II intron reverse transcriptase/maturase [Geosporobacter subterraneus DSM 17957]|uniref:Group II intron reverse transcriptase/maturase n=1 Tax=Geosporobacter subterraneus DSM 17957 TaxID=1121919 RepID=A0A1M6FQH4_9FIRM|nr:group II intron reverse transcriptase/maturase [Geosporobacter subterraneus]SHI99849.1 group II intron reverse transcriptase/maturase [Geosporobacter subterraneus DSM 17957]
MNVTKIGTKESRTRCCSNGYCQRDSAEHKGYDRALTEKRITESNITNADSEVNGILEQILDRDNLNRAFKQVKKNKGSHGVDGMEVEHLLQYPKDNGNELRETILEGKYHPNPVRRVEIPKDNGKKRNLGIPTAVDRVIQQAILQVLSPIFEPQFSETSYGFRPKRSTHDAIKKCKEYANEGYTYVVDMDLEKFFDVVNQSKMVEILSRTIKDGRVISLIHKYLRAGAIVGRRFEETNIGLAQGGNISPLCSNIMLNELDKELEKRGIKFVRYADDILLFARCKRSAKRILSNILPFIENKLKLRVNREKTTVAYIGKIKFLGYGFYPSKAGIKLRVHSKSVAKMKDKIREVTSRSNGIGYEVLKLKLKQFVVGWVNYFKLADMKNLLLNTDQWLRRRLRMFIWKRWKKIKTRYRMLRKLGYNHSNAKKYSNTRKGYWHIAGSQILSCSITDNRLREAGYQFFTDYYKTVSA